MNHFETQVLLALGVEPATVERAIFVAKVFGAKQAAQRAVGMAESGLAESQGLTEVLQNTAQQWPVMEMVHIERPTRALDPELRRRLNRA